MPLGMDACLLRKCHLINICIRQYATHTLPIPRIIVPHKWVVNHEKKKQREFAKKLKSRKTINYKSPLVISCKRAEYNHHRGQSYSGFDPKKVLASHGWKHNKSVGDYFTLTPYAENPALQKDEQALTFEELNLKDWITARLKENGLVYPTMIQRKTIPKMLHGHNVMCAAETGSGKTLAYLLPLLQILDTVNSLKTEEEITTEQWNAPQAVILVPTRELGTQIKKVADEFSVDSSVAVRLLSNEGSTQKKIDYPHRRKLDIAISTPGVLYKLMASDVISPTKCRHVVLDEADTLLDDSFSHTIASLMKRLGVHGGVSTENSAFVNTGTQVALVSATLPKHAREALEDVISVEKIQKVSTRTLHHLMPHVSQKFMRIHHSQKSDEILKLGNKNYRDGITTMIFCNKSQTSYWLGSFLQENGIRNMILNSDMNIRRRYNRFQSYQRKSVDILICTDIASRGLDTSRVEQVINFDFPLYMSDYIHRAGRVGRVGSQSHGSVVSFVISPWDVELLWEIESSARQARELKGVNANIKGHINNVSHKSKLKREQQKQQNSVTDFLNEDESIYEFQST